MSSNHHQVPFFRCINYQKTGSIRVTRCWLWFCTHCDTYCDNPFLDNPFECWGPCDIWRKSPPTDTFFHKRHTQGRLPESVMSWSPWRVRLRWRFSSEDRYTPILLQVWKNLHKVCGTLLQPPHVFGALLTLGRARSEKKLDSAYPSGPTNYRRISLDRPDPILFMSLTVNTSVTVCMMSSFVWFSSILIIVRHRFWLMNSGRTRISLVFFEWFCCLTNLKDSVGLKMSTVAVRWISIPLDLSSLSFIPLPRFIRPRRAKPLLTTSLVLFPPTSVWAVHHSTGCLV